MKLNALSSEDYVPKPRVQFGNYHFVEVVPDPKMPILRCCASHSGDADYNIPYMNGTVCYFNYNI